MAVRRFRDNGTEKSIHSFHAEHEVLSRQEYSVPPAHRLDPREPEPQDARREAEPRPRLTVVHPGDTYRSLESRTSWDEWANDYDYEREDELAQQSEPTNRYVSAYSSVPNEQEILNSYNPPMRAGSMKARRTTVFLMLGALAVVLSGINFAVSYSLIEDLAILAWLGLVCYIALALFAVSMGYLYESSLPIRIPQGRRVATIEPLYGEFEDEYETEFYADDGDEQWRRDSPSRFAVG